ncbi:MAG: class I SAM-dependent methyltransferase [Opitutales bacterium]
MSKTNTYSDTVQKAREYYNSDDADNFYFTIWGGEDIHIGLYQNDEEPIMDASRRTVAEMAKLLGSLPAQAHILDIGAGYGGSARYLAREHGYRVTAFNLSEIENERDRKLNQEQGLDHLVDVVDGDFENLPFADESFDAVWSQDAILHSGNRKKVFEEVDRVLKPGGHFVLTDILQQPDVDPAALQPVYDRIHLDSLGSEQAYDGYADDLGWRKKVFQAMPEQLPRHYQRVHDTLTGQREDLSKVISEAYMDRMEKGLQHWIEAGRAGRLTWGILHYEKS